MRGRAFGVVLRGVAAAGGVGLAGGESAAERESGMRPAEAARRRKLRGIMVIP